MAINVTPVLNPASGTKAAPLIMDFAGVAGGTYPPFSYLWRFGDGYTSQLPVGTHEYLHGGTYDVSLVVTDALGHTASWSESYVVNPVLDAAFTSVVTNGPGGTNSVQFTDATTGGDPAYSYAWDFGDGWTSTAQNPSHVYAEAGSYVVRLVVTDSLSRISRTLENIEITNPMTVAITAVLQPGSNPQTYDFTAAAANGTGPYTYAWDFGDGHTATGASVSHSYPKGGQYAASVAVVDALGHDTGAAAFINIVPALFADPVRMPELGKSPFPSTFYARVSGGRGPYRFAWDFADGETSTEENPVHSFKMPGFYNVTLVIVDSRNTLFSTVVAVDAGAGPLPTEVPQITSPLDVTARIGEPFYYKITANHQPTSFGASGLPAGLGFNSQTGVISGYPTTSPTSCTISATNVVGTGSATLNLHFAPSINSSLIANAPVGSPFSYQITALNSPTSFDAWNLPDGVSVNQTTGLLSGTPSGIIRTKIKAINGVGFDIKELAISLAPGGGGGDFLTGQEINLQQGLDQTFTIAYTGTPTIIESGPLPDGLTLNGSNGNISGLPTVYGDFVVAVSITYSDHVSAGSMILHIAQAFVPEFTFINDPLTWHEGVYNQLNLTLAPNPLPVTWDIQNLPPNIYDYQYPSSDHIIYGVPYGSGVFEVSITATNWAGSTNIIVQITTDVSSFQVSNTGTAFDDIYAPSDQGFYSQNYDGAGPVDFNPGGYATPGPVRVYRAQNDSNKAIFYFETYQCWLIDDTSTFVGGPPFAVFPTNNQASPPEGSWNNSPFHTAVVTRV
ncbi:MAG: PKD domain-containing protein [Phycisphaerae bacterium]|jgi:PKD repeat protein